MSARVLPVLSILVAAILYLVDINTYTQMFFMSVVIMFLAVSITWWWWVMYAIRDIHKNINISIQEFTNIREDIKNLREDIKKVK
jgi:ABC-type bacteriocin/lantibiotic exporter with double-glycine peptidase domain